MNRNFPMKEKSRLVTVAIAAMPKKIAAVMPPANATSCPPLLKPAATVRIGVRNSPATNVKPNSAAMPQALLRSSGDDEQHAHHHAEHQQRRHDRRRLEQRDEVHLHADQRAGDHGQQRQREQPVGVAQHAIARARQRAALRGQRGAAAAERYRLESGIHVSSVSGPKRAGSSG